MIDPELQAELRQRFNPDGSELRKMQLRMLEMLKYIDRICRENDIKYWLSSGTCLGAVRHGGFIPWDDDVDIEMLEEDYKKLIMVLNESKHPSYVLQTHRTDPGYYLDFAKLRDVSTQIQETFGVDSRYKYQGLFIDIFHLSESGSSKIHYICGRLRVLENYVRRWSMRYSRLGDAIFWSIHFVDNIVISLSRPFDRIGSNGDRLRHTLGISFLAPRCKSDIFPLKRVKYEDVMMPVPGNYDAYLTAMYGDYMEMKQTHMHLNNSHQKQ